MDAWNTEHRHIVSEISAEIAYMEFKIAVYEQYLYEIRRGNGDEIRLGQLYFNMLINRQPNVANAIRGTIYDPYHRESISRSVEDRVIELWARLPEYRDLWVV
jgi:hypothetical protein